jgi:hypothetical protein
MASDRPGRFEETETVPPAEFGRLQNGTYHSTGQSLKPIFSSVLSSSSLLSTGFMRALGVEACRAISSRAA